MAALLSVHHATLTAQSATASHPVSILESRAQAVLGQKSIRVALPLSAPATGTERVIASILSPANATSGETAAVLRPGVLTADLTLPWPSDAHGKPADDIGWYRIGYRLESGATVKRGMLSIGAIAPNLLSLRMAHPSKAIIGMPISVRVFAGNPVTQRPFKGVRLKATLTTDDDAPPRASKRAVIRDATTDAAGEASFSFPGPVNPRVTTTINVEGTLTNSAIPDAFAHASLASDIDSDDRTSIHAETDKPLHKPGEIVHLRALVLNNNGRAAADTGVTLTIEDSDNKTVEEASLKTNHFGIASYDWKTTRQTATGDYTAAFDIGAESEYEGGGGVELRIERYDLPEFTVTASMDSGFYLQGQTPTVKIHAGYLFGKPVAAGTIKIARSSREQWNPKTRKYETSDKPELTGTLDPDGNAEFKLDVKEDFGDLKDRDYDRYTDHEYHAIVTDASTGRSEPRNFTVRLSHHPVHIYVTGLGGNDREGDYLVSTSYADGTPAACSIKLDWMSDEQHPARAASAATNRYGLAKVHLVYPPAPESKESYRSISLRISALDREGRTSTFDDSLSPYDSAGMWITLAHTLLRPGDPIEATIHGPVSSTVDVDVLSENGLLAHLRAHLAHGSSQLIIPSNPSFHGLVTLQAYTMNGDEDDYHGYRSSYNFSDKSVLYPEDRELRVKLTGLKTSYSPGTEVKAVLNVNDAASTLPRGALGVSVFDTAVAQRAETEEESNQHWWGSYWWLGNSIAGGLTRAMLDKTDTSQPIPADLDLAAEAILRENSANDIEIESTGDSSERNAYTSAMQGDLYPVGNAINAVSSVHLPATLETVRDAVRAAKLDEALLIDPWNTPYKIAPSTSWNNEIIAFTSAGPDKRFGTGDDISITVAQRNIFAVPGRRLSAILEQTAAADHPLPGTLDALKALAKSNGLDLDSASQGTLDQDGKPYLYAIVLQRSLYTIEVKRDDGLAIWSGPSVHYFSRTESRMDAALQSWENAGKPFPLTEPEARQVFTAAGLDFDSLRDPFGEPFQLHCAQLTTYSTVEHVVAGKTLQVTDQSISHRMQAVQVLRSPDAGESAYQSDLVTQFLHPVDEQSGRDLKPRPVEQGTFNGNTGAISGTVTDQSGAVIPNATVTATDAGGNEFTIQTSDAGTYLIRDLAPGLYSLKVSARAFQSFSIRDVHVAAASRTIVDVTLNVGSVSETVEVASSPMALQTDSATISVSAVADLPPGVVAPNAKVVKTPTGRALISEPTFTPRLRHVFEETAYWAPCLETDSAGRAALRFRLPDSLTTWKLHAIASTTDGRIGALDQTFKTFQPFFVDLDAPQVLTQGDEITLPVNLRNYTAQTLALPVTVKPAPWLDLLTASTVRASVPSNGSTPVNFGFRAAKFVDQGPLQISAANAATGDAVEKQVRVHPDGEPGSSNASTLLRGQTNTLELDLPANLIPGSMQATVRLYPNLGSQIVHAMQAALQRPYGCGEQTISSTYPSLLFLELAKASGIQSTAADQAQAYLELGYDRLLSYFDVAGGLTYWGGSDHNPDPALTAYGITFLLEADPYIKVDHDQIARAIRWLLDHQQPDGFWTPHYGSPQPDVALYIAAALAHANTAAPDLTPRINAAVAKAIEWASKSIAAVHDPYANALRLQLAAGSQDSATIARLREELSSTAVRDRDGAHWSRSGYSPFYGWGRAGDLETTAIALSALSGENPAAASNSVTDAALYFLLHSRDRYGIWYSGQATVRVLKALLPFAIQQMKALPASSSFTLTINGAPLDAKDADALHADPRLLEAPRSLDVTLMLKPGHNELAFTAAGDNALASAEITAAWYTPWTAESLAATQQTQTGKDYGLDFGYQCAATNAAPGTPIQCTVDARRFGSRGYGMLLAEVGLPPGADVDRASLSKLLDNWTISRYEIQPDRIVFYLWSWNAQGAHFQFAFTPRYAIHAKAAPAILFDYYNPDLKSVLAPQNFLVQ